MAKRKPRPTGKRQAGRRKQVAHQPFDLAVKFLFESRAQDLVQFLGMEGGDVEIINIELQSVRRMVDHAWRLSQPVEHLVLVEFQSSFSPEVLERLNAYVGLLGEQYRLPVRPILLLLREEADSPLLTGEWEQGLANSPFQKLWYGCRRIHKELWEDLLAGPLGALPFAPIASGANERTAWITQQVIDRIQQEASAEQAEKLLVATYLLMGLRYHQMEVEPLFRGVQWMKDSTTYQAIIDSGYQKGWVEGRQEGIDEGKAVGLQEGKAVGLQEGKAAGERAALREAILELGSEQWGKPDAVVERAIGSLDDISHLKSILKQIPRVAGWTELLESANGE